MKWLIVEDALRSRHGHYFEYISTFWRDLHHLGDTATVLVDQTAQQFIVDAFSAVPILPRSIWARMSDRSSRMRRYARVPWHAWATYRALARWMPGVDSADIIFVPSVNVHLLLAWAFLIKRQKLPQSATVLLFFPSLPIHQLPDGKVEWQPSPTKRVLGRLFAWLRPEVETGKVVLGTETLAMQTALRQLTGLPVTYFPHPVALAEIDRPAAADGELVMGCYGPARFEKGSDLLQAAIAKYLEQYPTGRARFVFQWLDDFQDMAGRVVRLDPALQASGRVTVINRYFNDGEYGQWLRRTGVMLLPYRRSSYGLRLSRVLIEAMTCGYPVIATENTTLAEQLARFGAGLESAEESVSSLTAAMRNLEQRFGDLSAAAAARKAAARQHFSTKTFRDTLVSRHPAGRAPGSGPADA